MRRFLCLLTFACVAASASTLSAGVIADSISFQGRLTDASNAPVPNGNRDLIISLWSDSTGGTMLHSEIVVITTSSGLYSTCIGCGSSTISELFDGRTLWLETQLAGQPAMTPRTRLRSVPSSVTSSSLHGQSVFPGGGIVSAAVSSVGNLAGAGGGAAAASYARLGADSDGDGHDDFFITDSARTDGVHHVTGGDLDGDGSPELASALEVRVDRIEMKLYDDSDALQRNSVTQGASTDSANQMLSTDLDGDGIPDVVVASSVRPSSASLAIKTKGTSAQRLSAGGDCDDTDSEIFADCDDDNDGVAESRVSASSGLDGASFSMQSTNNNMPNRISMNVTVPKQTQRCVISQGSDSDLDGIDETSMASTVERKSGSIIFSDREGNEVVRSMAGVDSTRGVLTTDSDSDGDGVPEDEAIMQVTPGAAYHAIKTKGTGADANRLIFVSGSVGSASAVHSTGIDDDGDTVPESEISQTVTPTTSSVAIKTKGTGADKDRVAGSSANDSSAVNYLDIDDDADGISEAHAVSSVSSVAGAGGGAAAASYAATGRWYTDSDDDGLPEGDIEAIATPGTCGVAIKTRGTGADKNRTISSTTDTSKAVTVHSADTDGDGLADRVIREECDDDDASITVARGTSEIKIRHKGWDGTIKGRMAIENGGTIEVDFAGDGVGFVSQRFGIGVLSPTNPLEHSSGAHLTAGGVWTNASDENLKENFQPVDGAELLDKIEQLPISEWNYKTESDEVKHIGPTAQDFQKVFGIGENDKTISTIDPSGIALAAIKELNNKLNTQNQTLSQENKQLRKEMEELKKMVQELAKAK